MSSLLVDDRIMLSPDPLEIHSEIRASAERNLEQAKFASIYTSDFSNPDQVTDLSARKKKLLIHAAAQAQRAVDYVLRRRSDRWFTIIVKLFEQARALSLFIPLKAKHSTIHFLHSSEVP